MAKDKERSVNPAQQQRKLDKAKALKKGKAEVQARRNEKLARRNPDRLQKQVDDLKALETSGEIKPREKQILADLERDLRAVRKAREALGDQAPQYGNRQGGQQLKKEGDENSRNILGKRRHNGERKFPHHNPFQQDESSSSDTDDSVRRIPMPKDTPPPTPNAFRSRNHPRPGNANLEPLGEGRGGGLDRHPQRPVEQQPQALHSKSIPEARTFYSSAPQIRDLKKEAVGRFVPTVVQQKQKAARGLGGQLVEPEEMDRLEAEGYVSRNQQLEKDKAKEMDRGSPSEVRIDEEARRLAEEEARFQRELEMHEMSLDGDVGNEGDLAVAGSDGLGRPGARGYHTVEIEEVEDEDM